jgi:hypothetical protein
MSRSRIRRLQLLIAVAAALTLSIQLVAPGAGVSSPDAPTDMEHGARRGADPAQQPAAQQNAGLVEDGVRLIGHADPGGGFHADVVAHKGFAYLGSWGAGAARCPSRGVRVFDLSDLSNPEHVATFADGASEPETDGSWTEKIIVQSFAGPRFRGDLAAVSFQRCGGAARPGLRGFGVYDVTDPTNPSQLSLVTLPGAGSHEIWIERRGNKAYVYTAIFGGGGAELVTGGAEADFQIWDVSDPRNPVKVGQWGAWAQLGVHPTEPENGVSRSRRVHSVIGAVMGKQHLAYLSYWDFGTVILDVTDPSDPQFLGRTTFELHEEGNAHSAWLARGGNILIQTDEDFNPTGPAGIEPAWGYGRIFDISDPSNPVQLSTVEMPTTRDPSPDRPGDFSVHDPKVRGNTAYFSWYAEGVVMFDISDPTNPRQIAQFLPPPAEDPMGLFTPAQVNVWGVYVERNYVLASDMSSGLWVFRLDRSA